MNNDSYQARRAARRRLGFEIHAGAFFVYMLATLAASMLIPARPLWLLWPVAGWGVGLAIHYLVISPVFARRLHSLTQAELARRQGETS